MTQKGRRPSFALLQALELVAAGHSVNRFAADAGIASFGVWVAMKTHGKEADPVAARAAAALAHYCEVEPAPGAPVRAPLQMPEGL